MNLKKEAIHLILTGIGDEIYSTVDACQTAQEMWEAIERLQQGESLNIQDVKTNLFWEFGQFTSHDGETIESYYTRFYKMMNVIEQVAARSGMDSKMAELVMSSPNHPTSDIEDAFSSNFPDYIPASPNYVSASQGKTYSGSSNNSFGLVPIASPTLSLFHDDRGKDCRGSRIGL
ncbi:hypothetical protein Tco_0276478 [Tanacetum coccineum]